MRNTEEANSLMHISLCRADVYRFFKVTNYQCIPYVSTTHSLAPDKTPILLDMSNSSKHWTLNFVFDFDAFFWYLETIVSHMWSMCKWFQFHLFNLSTRNYANGHRFMLIRWANIFFGGDDDRDDMLLTISNEMAMIIFRESIALWEQTIACQLFLHINAMCRVLYGSL